MTNILKKTAILTASVLFASIAFAQDESFDLSSQRSESQVVNPVPGKKVDHKGLIINPTPQEIQIKESKVLNIGRGLKLIDVKKKFKDDLGFAKLRMAGVDLKIDYGHKVAAKYDVKPVSGAYVLQINLKGITIIGYDEKGAFYGIQTLRQLLESPEGADEKFPYT